MNQAKPQVTTAVSPQTARNFGLDHGLKDQDGTTSAGNHNPIFNPERAARKGTED